MCSKENEFCFFFIYIITVISLPASWCEAPPPNQNSHLAPRSRRHEEGGHPPDFHRLRTGLGTQTEPSVRGGPEPTALKGGADPSLDPAQEDCGRAEVQRVVHGTFYVTAQLDAGSDPGPIRDQQSWRRLQPVVECGDDAMTLTVRRRHAEQLQLDRVNGSSVPLARLPPPCGFSVQTTATQLRLRVRYDGCHVTQQGERHLLPLLWRGSSMTASCPAAGPRPVDPSLSALCCSSGFVVAMQGPSAEALMVNVKGRLAPVELLAAQCGFAVERRRADVVVTAPFAACGVTVKGGKHSLSLHRAEDAFTLSCPVSPAHGLSKVRAPLIRLSPHGSRELSRSWAPPFYLAPLYYPHPTQHYGPGPQERAAPASDPDSWDPPQTNDRPSRLTSAADERKGPSLVHPGLQLRPEPPPPQPPGQAFNPYYYFYHHPKIPRPGPGPDAAEHLPLIGSEKLELQDWDVASDQLPHPAFGPPLPPPSPPSFHHLPFFASSGSVRPDVETNAFPAEDHDKPYIHYLHDTRTAKKRQLFPEDDVTAAPDDGSRSAPPASRSSGLQPPHSHYFSPFYVHGPAAAERRLPPVNPDGATGPAERYPHPEAAAEPRPASVTDSGDAPPHGFYSAPPPHGRSVHPRGQKGRLEANAPSAPSCHSPHLHCARSLGCCSYHVRDCTLGQHLVLVLPDCLLSPALAAPLNASCALQKLTSDPGLYAAPLLGCGVGKHVFGDTVVYLVEVRGFQAHPLVYASPVRLLVECRSSPGSQAEVRLHVLDPLPPALVAVQLRVTSDPSFSRFHPEARLPLSRLRGRPLYLEVSLLDPPDPRLVLLVHSCLAHTLFFSWMPIYDGCSSRADSQLLPVPDPNSHRVRRIAVSSFMSPPPESPPSSTGGSSPPDDPQIYFLCLTEVCSSSDEDCTIRCGNGPNSRQ
ncbi:uncharacterized protein LOC114860149 [Betta splendens]|uniref:Uncharacterized protein LOC114860149 n=1 Tax=Betta splendens TaxID=158456 RepID=A0A6P7N920_BETSP|nr:uncharacterized protein LOC114860149 [Betta splendens]